MDVNASPHPPTPTQGAPGAQPADTAYGSRVQGERLRRQVGQQPWVQVGEPVREPRRDEGDAPAAEVARGTISALLVDSLAQRAIARLGHLATYAELRTLLTDQQIADAVRAGEVRRVGRGRYTSGLWPEELARAYGQSAVVSHLSAAQLHGWKVKQAADRIHVTVPRKRRRRAAHAPLALHWRHLPDAETAEGVTSPLRTVMDCARTLPFDEALVIADQALRLGAVRRPELLTAAEASRGPGALAARRVARLADGRAANPLESCLRAIALGVPGLEVTPQQTIRAPGLRTDVDLADPALRLAIEAEGYEHHGSRAGLRRDCRRYTALAAMGWVIARYSYEDIMGDPGWVHHSLQQLVIELAA